MHILNRKASSLAVVGGLVVGSLLLTPTGVVAADGGSLSTSEAGALAREALNEPGAARQADGEYRLVTVEEGAGGRPRVVVHEVDGVSEATSVVKDASKGGDLVGVEVDSVVSTFEGAPNDPYVAEQWSLAKTDVLSAWPLTRGAGVTVAVIDTGVNAAHPDLAGQVLAGRDFSVDPSVAAAGVDPNGHGTHVAGIIAALADNGVGVAGAAPAVKILPVRVLDASGKGTASSIANGIVWAVDNGAQVINLSLGGIKPATATKEAVEYAAAKGVTVVAAAGNGGPGFLAYPAAYPSVISVGSFDDVGVVSPFSATNSEVDLVAPGEDIWSTYRDDYKQMSGTSMASPFAAAVGALALAANPSLTPDQVRARLISSAVDAGTPGRDDAYGAGRINPNAAVRGAYPPSAAPVLGPVSAGFAVGVNRLRGSFTSVAASPAVTGYRITAVSPAGEVSVSKVVNAAGSFELDASDGLRSGYRYSVQVRALNAGGDGTLSAAQTSPTVYGVPAAPRLSVNNLGLLFLAAYEAEPLATSYTITAVPVSGGTTISTTMTKPGFIDLSPAAGFVLGTTYTVTAVAANAIGVGPVSNTVTPPPAGAPNQGQPLTSAKGGYQSISASIPAAVPADPAGFEVTSYRVTATRSGVVPKVITKTVATTGPFTLTAADGLGVGVWRLSYTRLNKYGESLSSAWSGDVVFEDAPNVAPQVTYLFTQATQLVVGFRILRGFESIPTMRATKYEITAVPVSGGYSTVTTQVETIKGNNEVRLNVSTGATYRVTVRAGNSHGFGPASDPLASDMVCGPQKPPNLTSLIAGESTLSGSFDAATGFCVPATATYTINAVPNGGGTTAIKTVASAGSFTLSAADGVAVGKSYTVTVALDGGSQPWSNSMKSDVVGPKAPKAPTLNGSLTVGIRTVSGSFSTVIAAPAVTSYTITAVPGGGGTTVTKSVTVTGGVSLASFTLAAADGIVAGKAYTVTVTATNATGTSPASNSLTSAVVPAGSPPPAPTLGGSLTIGVKSVSGNFSAVTAAPTVSSYTIRAVPGGGGTTVTKTVTVAGAFTLNAADGIVSGKAYTVTVTATNAVGTSPASNSRTSAVVK